jgi:hypothetical protein
MCVMMALRRTSIALTKILAAQQQSAFHDFFGDRLLAKSRCAELNHGLAKNRHPGESRGLATLVLDVRLDPIESRWAPALAGVTNQRMHGAFFTSS